MIVLLDGPAAKSALACARAPMYLRVVVDREGKVDALDQPEDTPSELETIHVYAIVEGSYKGVALVMMARPRGCVRCAMAEYRHLAEVDGEAMRETDAWREWALAQPAIRREPLAEPSPTP